MSKLNLNNVNIDEFKTEETTNGLDLGKIDLNKESGVPEFAVKSNPEKVKQFMKTVATSEYQKTLQPHQTLSAEAVSPANKEAAQVETAKYVDKMVEQANENVSQFVEAQEIFEDVRDQLVATGRVSHQNASVMALKFYDSPFHATHEERVATKMALKMDLSIMISNAIDQKGWSQKEASEALGVPRSRISELKNNKIELFTIDAMFDMLDKFGFEAKMTSPSITEAKIVITQQLVVRT